LVRTVVIRIEQTDHRRRGPRVRSHDTTRTTLDNLEFSGLASKPVRSDNDEIVAGLTAERAGAIFEVRCRFITTAHLSHAFSFHANPSNTQNSPTPGSTERPIRARSNGPSFGSDIGTRLQSPTETHR
jgi:hypothetical protein